MLWVNGLIGEERWWAGGHVDNNKLGVRFRASGIGFGIDLKGRNRMAYGGWGLGGFTGYNNKLRC